MSKVGLILSRELKAYIRSPLGYAAIAGVLLLDGILFMASPWTLGMPQARRLGGQVLYGFFFGSSGPAAILCVVLAMRLIAAEQDQGTLVLLKTSPVRDWEVVLGKFLSVMVVMTVLTALTAYMPALIYYNVDGKLSLGHILVGYSGLLLLCAAVTAVGLFGSALAKNQVVGAILAGVLVGVMYLLWLVAKISDPPLQGFIEGLALHHERFRDFARGILRLENVGYYLGVTFFFLLASIKTLEARRWR